VPVWSEAKVHPDHHVQVARSLYSVPTAYIGRHLDVRLDSKSVRLYSGAELVKVHARVAPGKRSTDPADYPRTKTAYALRSVDALVGAARAKGQHVGAFAEKLLSGPLPWSKMRQAQALMRLCDRHVIDDFALEPMTREESRDVYQRFVERTGRASTVVTSNRDTAEWLTTFDDTLLAQSAIDRFQNAAYDLVIEGESYRPRLKPTIDKAGPTPDRPVEKKPVHPRQKRHR
jgi:hypothetical protein